MTDKKETALTSRRNFLKKALEGATAATAAASVPVPALATAVTKPKKQYAMVIDTRRCIGCHACSVACKSEFDVPLGVYRSWVEYTDKGDYPSVQRTFLPRLCNHCSEPPCVYVCPTGATWKREDNGVVVIDKDICIGCKYCIQACPYDMRFYNPVTGTADKCDFCEHRTSRGLEPSCVNTCQGRARIFGDITDPESEVSRLLAKHSVTVLREGMGTHPNVYYIEADHTDESEKEYRDTYIRVTTHRKIKERR
ncbi:MAG: 4Fe-4S dicluster domain-containing protein [Gammaproteobacteria bacterium]|nr:MAG: 4Fe-4S dicluster domain-containing protein [Gammaproteobacteria bacterium]